MPKSDLDRLRAINARLDAAPVFAGMTPADHAEDLTCNLDVARVMGYRAADLADVQRDLWHLQDQAGVTDAALAEAMEKTLAEDCARFNLDAQGRPKPILPKPHPGDYVGAWDWPEFAGLARLADLIRKPSLRRAAILAAILAAFAAATWAAKLAWLAVLT